MTRLFNSAFLMLLAAVAVWLAPTAKADQWDKRTILTFNAPVEIPGQVLVPGTYVFKLADDIDRTTVFVYTEDEQHLIATIRAVPAYRVQRTSNTAVTFEERAAGSPQALHDWFYPADNNGLEFVYPKTGKQVTVAQTQPAAMPAPVAAPAAAPEPEQQTQAQPEPEGRSTIILREEEIFIAQAILPAPIYFSAQDDSNALQTLPQTAGNFALIPLGGLLLLSGGFTALRFATKTV